MSCVSLPYELESECRNTIEIHALNESLPDFVRNAARERMKYLNSGKKQ